jgi:hypothetical protein
MKTYALLRVQFVSYLTLSIFTVATHVAAVQPKEIVGTWRDQHGAVTELRGDGTYRSHFADEYGTGTWRLSKGVLLRLQWYLAYWNKTSGETYRIISFKKDIMRLQGPEGSERWTRQKQKIRWPKELEEIGK